MRFLRHTVAGLWALSAAIGQAADLASPLARFVGSPSCASSSCHGGAGPRRDQVGQWETRDVHRRAASTLNTARSEQMARALGLTNSLGQAVPQQHPRCTSCHAPEATIPAGLRLREPVVSEVFGCETCHGPAENWLRSHTRPGSPRDDFRYGDKLADGLRDLRDLRVRANGCVACHENVERTLLEAGHPELMFELDGQTRQEPRHWVEKSGYRGAQAWLVGQAVAWREVAWWRTQPGEASDRLTGRAEALAWLVTKAAQRLDVRETGPDGIARRISARTWADPDTESVLRALVDSASDFRGTAVKSADQARRAECLVLALDRLAADLPEARAKTLAAGIDDLFKLAQSRPDFDSERFAAALVALANQL